MGESANIRRGVQFAHDLREIREANGISVEDIHNESKIPVGLIESFEENGLFDHSMFNRVYLRSFVRTYADVIRISPDVALASLESALDGTYRRALAVEYLGLEPPPEPVADLDDTVIPEPEPGEESAVSAGPRRAAPPAPGATSHRPPAHFADEPTEDAPGEDVEETFVSAGAGEDVWTSQSPPPGTRIASRRRDRSGRQWLYVVLVAAIVLAAVWAIVNIGGVEEVAPDEPDGPALDTVETQVPPVVVEEAPPPVVLGDTMHVTIASADSQLVQDIKVTVDDDLRRPYWLEAGESQTFTPLERIVIEQELDVIDLLLEGRPYPTDRVDDQGRVVITRESARQFLADSQ